MGDTYYRYQDVAFEDGIRLVLETYTVERETPRGVWLLPPYACSKARWMKRGSRFAHTAKEAAWQSYRARKEAQLRHAFAAMRRVKAALAMEFGDDERRVVRTYEIAICD